MYEHDTDFGAEFGGRAARKRRRSNRRSKIKGGLKKVGRKLAKVGKPFKKIVTAKWFKTILSYIPVYGPTAVAAIEAGEAIAKNAKKAVEKVDEINDELQDAIGRGDTKAAASLRAQANRAAAKAKAELEKLGREKLAEKKVVATVASRAQSGDPRSTRALMALRMGSPAARRSLKTAVRKVAKQLPKPTPPSTATQAPPGGDEVVVLTAGRRFVFSRAKLRSAP